MKPIGRVALFLFVLVSSALGQSPATPAKPLTYSAMACEAKYRDTEHALVEAAIATLYQSKAQDLITATRNVVENGYSRVADRQPDDLLVFCSTSAIADLDTIVDALTKRGWLKSEARIALERQQEIAKQAAALDAAANAWKK